MSRSRFGRRIAQGTPVVASIVLALAVVGQASAVGPTKARKPRASTGGVAHVRGTSALLEGIVNPEGADTTYFFQYGPTTTYGSVTPTAAAGKGVLSVKVGQTVNGLFQGYHYRLIAKSVSGTSEGRDRIFTAKKLRPTFVIAKGKEETVTVFESPFVLTGTLSGAGIGPHQLVLQASPYPFLTPFTTVGLPIFANAGGGFAFRVRNIRETTEFRVATLDPRPFFSPVVTEHVAVRVSFKVRSAGRKGLVRLYGTITPAKVGARVSFQLRKAVRPTRSEQSTRFTSRFSTVTKKGTKSVSRFSAVVSIRETGRYRAYVKLGKGPQVSGSSSTVVIHAGPTGTHKPKRK